MKIGAACYVTLASLLLVAPAARAATFVCASGDVACVIAAINTANANGESSNTLRLAAGVYTLASVDNTTDGPNGLPAITSTLALVADVAGSEVTLTRGTPAPSFRFFYVASNGAPTLDGLTLTSATIAVRTDGGSVTITRSALNSNSAAAIDSTQGSVIITDSTMAGNRGSAVFATGGTLAISRSTMDRNVALGPGAITTTGTILTITDTRLSSNSGLHPVGALWMRGGSGIITRSTFIGNIADPIGAIEVTDGASLVIRDSAFIGNYVGGPPEGSAIFIGNSRVDIVNTTFADGLGTRAAWWSEIQSTDSELHVLNSTFAPLDILGPPRAGVILSSNGTATIQNSIVRLGREPSESCLQSITSLGNNRFDSEFATCRFILHGTDTIGDAGLGALTDTGLPGAAYLPLNDGSPAIDAGNVAACPVTDQLGQARNGICDIGAVEFGGSGSTTPSTSGTRVPPAAAIIDLALASWTFGPNGETLRNGVFVEGYGTQYLWFQNGLYVFGLDGNWWQWTGSFWAVVGPNDPSGNGPAMQPSPSGTRVPPAAAIVDAGLASWTLGPGGETLRNGLQAGGGVGSQYLWYQNVLYTLGSDSNWWQWTGSGWVVVGPSDPSGGSGGGTSPSGTHATTVVDGDRATWTLGSGGETLRNGVHAAGGYGSLYLWYQDVLYVIGTDGNWWRWTGSGWVFVGATDPSGGSNGGPSPSGTHATTIVDGDGATWTIGSGGETLRNGVHAAGGYGSLYLWYQDVLYVIGTDGNWWRWTGSGWAIFGPAPDEDPLLALVANVRHMSSGVPARMT